eukprot:Polyplicarium_translucidae@DN1758_c0_g1_i2.p1
MEGVLPDGVSDPYSLLGVDEKISRKHLNRAFRRKALQLHPDKNREDPEAEERFRLLQVAYEFLLDDKRRGAYDFQLRVQAERRRRYAQQDAEKRSFAERLSAREGTSAAERWEEQTTLKRMREENVALRTQAASHAQKRRPARHHPAAPAATAPPTSRPEEGARFTAFESDTLARLKRAAEAQKAASKEQPAAPA